MSKKGGVPRIFAKREHALYAGVAALMLGAVLLHDAYEGRGVDRPFWVKFLPAS